MKFDNIIQPIRDEDGNVEYVVDDNQVDLSSELPSQIPQSAGERMVQEERVNNLVAQTSPTNDLKRIDYLLRGYVWNEETKEWEKVIEFEIPDKIRNDFIQKLSVYVSENVRMTNLETYQINNIMNMLISWVSAYLIVASEKFNLEETEMDKIGNIFLSAAYFTLLRARGGVEKKDIFDSYKMIESMHPPAPQQSKGIISATLGKLFGSS